MMRKINVGIILCTLVLSAFLTQAESMTDNKDENSLICRLSVNTNIDTDHWPMFCHDLNRSGYSTSEAPDTDEIIWSYSVGSTSSSPVVYDYKVFIGSDKLYCLNAKYGTEEWIFDVDANIDSTPAISDGKIFFSTDDNHIYCLNTQTSDLIWSYETNDKVSSSPAIYNGKVYFGSLDRNVYCLDADPSDGIDEGHDDPNWVDYDLIWKYETNRLIMSSPAVYDNKVIIGSTDSRLYCLDAIGNENGTTNKIWDLRIYKSWLSTPTIFNQKIYIGAPSWQNEFLCLNFLNGSKIWEYSLSTPSSPAIAYNRVYYGAYDNKTYCFDADPFDDGVDEGITDPPDSDYDSIWSFEIGNYIYSSPAVGDNKVFIGSDDGKIYCLDATTGLEIWSCKIGDNIQSSPAIAYGNLYISSDDGNLYCFGHNEPPDVPDKPTGPTEGQAGVEYEFSTNPVTDPEGDPIFYLFDWGNGEDSGWIDTTTANYTWFEEGTYEVKVKAKDIVDKESDFSDILQVTILAPKLVIDSISSGLLGLKAVIKNIGTDEAQNVIYQITYFNQTMAFLFWPKSSVKNGTIINIPIDGQTIIRSVPFGLGGLIPQLRVPIEVMISIPELRFEEIKTTYAMIVGPIVRIE